MSCLRVTVLGATTAQGVAVVRALLRGPARRFVVRAATPRPDSRGAELLQALGAEIVELDLDDEASVRAALQDAQGAFCGSDARARHDGERARRQALNLASAARREGLRQLLWATGLPAGTFAPDDALLRAAAQTQRLPVTLLRLPFLWDGLLEPGCWLAPAGGSSPSPTSPLTLALPLGADRLPGMARSDLGPLVAALLLQGPAQRPAELALAAEHLDGAQMAASLSLALGRATHYLPLPPGALQAHDELLLGIARLRLGLAQPGAAYAPQHLRTLHPAALRFDDWLRRHAQQLPAARPLPTAPPAPSAPNPEMP